jgi:acetyl-CoA carboxylase biotin carboxyl carrier protein
MPESKGEKSSVAGGAMRIDPELVRELADLLAAHELTEIEVEDGDRRIKVSREPAPVFGSVAAASAPAATQAPAAAQPAPAPAPAAALAEEEVSGQAVKSPMVGTAYLSPEPGSKPFVSAGDAVKAGDTLVIVEAMKVMNPITAPSGGVVKKILISDGQPVEFDQPLIVIG